MPVFNQKTIFKESYYHRKKFFGIVIALSKVHLFKILFAMKKLVLKLIALLIFASAVSSCSVEYRDHHRYHHDEYHHEY
jgi:uncharacterized membrane protein YqhA